MDQINRLFDGATIEQIMENLRTDGSEWSKKQLDTLSKMVRLSIFVKFVC